MWWYMFSPSDKMCLILSCPTEICTSDDKFFLKKKNQFWFWSDGRSDSLEPDRISCAKFFIPKVALNLFISNMDVDHVNELNRSAKPLAKLRVGACGIDNLWHAANKIFICIKHFEMTWQGFQPCDWSRKLGPLWHIRLRDAFSKLVSIVRFSDWMFLIKSELNWPKSV